MPPKGDRDAEEARSRHRTASGRWLAKQGRRQPARLERVADEGPGQGARRQLAIERKTEHKIQNKEERITERNSYGNDPFPPRG